MRGSGNGALNPTQRTGGRGKSVPSGHREVTRARLLQGLAGEEGEGRPRSTRKRRWGGGRGDGHQLQAEPGSGAQT